MLAGSAPEKGLGNKGLKMASQIGPSGEPFGRMGLSEISRVGARDRPSVKLERAALGANETRGPASVMAGLVPAISIGKGTASPTGMAATRAAMTGVSFARKSDSVKKRSLL